MIFSSSLLENAVNEFAKLPGIGKKTALRLVLHLINSIRVHDDAVMYVDAKDFKQPLAAVSRSKSVKRALADMGQLDGKSVRELISHLMVHEIEMSHEIAQALMDIDTAADLEQAIAFAAKVKDNSSL